MLTGKKFFLILCGFFGVMFIANMTLAYFALKTNTGLHTQNAYQEGVEYQKKLDHSKAQYQANHKYEITLKPKAGNMKDVIVNASDENNNPLVGKDIEINFYRPAQEGNDRFAKLLEKESGKYYAEVELPFNGLWELRLKAEGASEYLYRSNSRVIIDE